MSYGRMKVRVQELEAEVKAMTEKAEETDRNEEGRPEKVVTILAHGLKRKEARLARIREAKARLEVKEKDSDPPGPAGGGGGG